MSEDKPAKSDASAEYDKIYKDLQKLAGVSNAPPPPPKLEDIVRHIPRSLNSERSYSPAAMKRPRPVQYNPVKADPDHWTKETEWEVDEAAVLAVDLDPREGLGLRIKNALGDDVDVGVPKLDLTPDEFALFKHAKTVRERAEGINSTLARKWSGYGVPFVTPADFAAWVQGRLPAGVPFPAWMAALETNAIHQYPSGQALINAEHDKRKQEAAQHELNEARAENERLQGELERLQKKLETTAELEPGERKTYRKLCKFYAKRYSFDPTANKSPAPGKMRRDMETDGISMDPDTVRKVLRIGAEDE